MVRLVGGVLAVSGAALAGLIWLELAGTRAEGDGPGAPARSLPTQAGPVGAAGAAQRAAWVETILARPLFTPGRRPPSAAVAAVAAAPVQALPRMTGILIDGRDRHAIFAASEGGRPVVVSEGGRIGAFTIESIEPQEVTIIGPDGKRSVRTSFDPRPAPPPITAGSTLPAGFPAGAPPGLPGQVRLGEPPQGLPAQGLAR